MSEQDLVLEPPPADDETAAPSPPTPETPETSGETAETTPEAETEQPPPVEKPRRTIIDDLQAERAARREAEQRAQSVAQELATAKPILQALARHPHGVQILQSLVQGAPLPQQGPPQPDPELQSIAEDLGLYNVDGTPDLVKAGRIQQRQHAVAQQAVQAAVAPLQQGTEAQQAQQSRVHLWQQAHQPENTHVDPTALKELLQALPDNIIKHQEVQSLVWVLAAGATALQGGKAPQTGPPMPTPPPTNPPVYSEQPGGRARPVTPLAQPFQQILKRAGMSDKDMQATLGKFVPNAPNLLE